MKPKILIVEDHELTRAGLTRYLKAKGYDPIATSSGEEAIALALKEHPDVILMDLGLPGMSGIEAAQVIKQEYPQISHIPIIAVSGRPRDLWEATALQAGISRYINKPASLPSIIEAIEEVRLTPAKMAVSR
jgi:CheY-like chemotaxis protein